MLGFTHRSSKFANAVKHIMHGIITNTKPKLLLSKPRAQAAKLSMRKKTEAQTRNILKIFSRRAASFTLIRKSAAIAVAARRTASRAFTTSATSVNHPSMFNPNPGQLSGPTLRQV
jgi:hypothetical protein